MMTKVLLYSKCRPQGADAWPIARDFKRVFVGYPAWRKFARGAPTEDWSTVGLKTQLLDISSRGFDDFEYEDYGRGYKSQITHNRHLALTVEPGSIVLVPRPNEGKCHAGQISGHFELVDRPAWGDNYLNMRRKSGLSVESEWSHVADVAQTWPVEEWTSLPFVAIPRWISYRLLSRNTSGIIADLEDPPVNALEVVAQLMDRTPGSAYQPIRGKEDLERALLDWVSPAAFEQLVVELMQLEHPELHWHHVGGSGDAGVDGIAVTVNGTMAGAIQCKWHYAWPAQTLLEDLSSRVPRSIPPAHRFVAVLHGCQDGPETSDNGHFLNRKRIAELVRKHKDDLVMAKSLGL